MVKPICAKCRKEINEFGGLIFSPPNVKSIENDCAIVQKIHICTHCFTKLMDWIEGFVHMH